MTTGPGGTGRVGVGPRAARIERGSALLLVVVVLAVAAAGLAALGRTGAAAVTAARADAAADASAHAAAVVLGRGGEPAAACAEARDLAQANRARLVACRVVGDGVRVEVRLGAARRRGAAEVVAEAELASR